MPTQTAHWVASDADLAAAVATWQPQIALDTEFIRTNTYYPMPGLYQVASGQEVFLLDPLNINDWRPFIEFLTSADTVKVMHACLEDLELLHHHLGVIPQNVFDTQYANAFLSENFSLSYTALVKHLLDETLEQHQTRSNWLQRPLTEEQLHYAEEDVTFLLPMYQRLSEGLNDTNRSQWFAHDMQLRSQYQPVDPFEYYRNVKKAWLLKDQQLAALKHLCAWREDTARSENVPRNRVIWDEHLYEFARLSALQIEDVRRALPRGVARRYAEHLVAQHATAQQAHVPPPLPKPLTTSQGTLLKSLRDVARTKAQSLGMAAELLARKKDLETLVRHHAQFSQLSPYYAGWREALVGEAFSSLLESHGDAA